MEQRNKYKCWMWPISNKKMTLEIVKYIKQKININLDLAVVLGSGLSDLHKILRNKIIIKYADIPNFRKTTVKGHDGKFIIGSYKGINIIFSLGRFHYYEGITIEEVGLPMKIFKELNCKNVILTNSSGCLNKNWQLGDIMLINGHFDFTFRNSKLNPTLIKDEKIYNKKLINIAKKIKHKTRIGYYGWVLGPMYETKAEIYNMNNCGVNAVGMSTIPELLTAKKYKIPAIAIALMSNYAVGLTNENLTHNNVLENSSKYNDNFKLFLIKLISQIHSVK